MRPAISDSLTSGHPLYLLNSNSNCGPLPLAAALAAARATQATGRVKLQVTGRAPTCSGLADAAAEDRGQFAAGRTQAPRAPRSSVRRPGSDDGGRDKVEQDRSGRSL